MGTPQWLDESRDPEPSRPQKLKESQESKSPNGKMSLEIFNGPNDYHPLAGDDIGFKISRGDGINEDSAEFTKKLKMLECVPPWQQDQLVPKGFKAKSFIRATGGGKGSDREAVDAKHAGDKDSPVVFNAPMNCVPPWKLDQPEKGSIKILKPGNVNEDGFDDNLFTKDRAASRNVPLHSYRPYSTHDEMILEQDMKR